MPTECCARAESARVTLHASDTPGVGRALRTLATAPSSACRGECDAPAAAALSALVGLEFSSACSGSSGKICRIKGGWRLSDAGSVACGCGLLAEMVRCPRLALDEERARPGGSSG